jgi:hypothetical protein
MTSTRKLKPSTSNTYILIEEYNRRKNTHVNQSNIMVFMETIASNFFSMYLSEGEMILLMRIFITTSSVPYLRVKNNVTF